MEKSLFIPKETATPEEVISTLLEGTINMIPCIFYEDKAFMLILTMDSIEKKDVFSIPVVREFPNVFPRDVTSLPPEREAEFLRDHEKDKGNMGKYEEGSGSTK